MAHGPILNLTADKSAAHNSSSGRQNGIFKVHSAARLGDPTPR